MLLCAQLRDRHIESVKAVFETVGMHESNRNIDDPRPGPATTEDQVFYVLVFELSRIES